MKLLFLFILTLPAILGNNSPENETTEETTLPFRKVCPVCKIVCTKLNCPPGSVEAQNAFRPCSCDHCPFCAVYKELGESCDYTQRWTSERRKRGINTVRNVCKKGLTCQNGTCN